MSVHTRVVMLARSLMLGLLLAAGSTSATGLVSASSASPPDGLSASDWGAIRAQVAARRYTAHNATDGSVIATNPTHGWHITYQPDGHTVLRPSVSDADTGVGYQIALQLQAVGYGDSVQAVGTTPALTAADNTVSYQWHPGLREWWVNSDQGVEQWFELAAPPAGRVANAPLSLTLALNTNLTATIGHDALQLRSADGATRIHYAGLKAWDADHAPLPASMALNDNVLTLAIDDTGARYPITIDPSFSQQAYLKASNTGINDSFGYSVAAFGDTVVVGARGEASSDTGINGDGMDNSAPYAGAAYVFVRDGLDNWSQQAYLKASNADAGDDFGISVAVFGDTVVVGAWLEGSSATGVNGDQADNSAPQSGAAYVFVRSGSVWTQQAYLKASNTHLFGCSVAVSGDTVVIGASGESSNASGINGNQSDNSAISSGAAYVFVRTGNNWTQQAYLKASNTGVLDLFGSFVAVSGDTVVVGAPFESSNASGINGNQANNSATKAGAAYVFVRSGSNWTQQAYLKASNTGAGDQFGGSGATTGNTVVIGARLEGSNATLVNGDQGNDTASAAGAAYVIVRDGSGNWSQQAYLKASNTGAQDQFGYSIAASGDTVVVGAPFENSSATGINDDQADNSAPGAGASYVFVRDGSGNWSQQVYLKASNTDASDGFGLSVAASGDRVVVGAPFEESSATGVNGDQTDNSAPGAGAAYVFQVTPATGQSGPFAYITNRRSNTVSVIDTASNAVVATIPVGSNPRGVAVNPGGGFAYVTNVDSNTVTAINTTDNSVAATVPVGSSPQCVAVNAAGTLVYVANSGSSNVSVIDAISNTVVATVPVGVNPCGIAVDPTGDHVYVTSLNSNAVWVIDTAANTVSAAVAVGTNPFGLVVHPSGSNVYVANETSNDVSVIDTASASVVATIAVGSSPTGVAIDSTGNFVYVTNIDSQTVSVIDTATNTVTATLTAGGALGGPVGIAIDPTGRFAYVANFGRNDVSVIDIATDSLVATIPVGVAPFALGRFIGGPTPPPGDGSIDSAGGTVSDTIFGARAQVTFPPAVLTTNTVVTIDVLADDLAITLPKGFSASGTRFVHIQLSPEPDFPLPAPGLTVTLPLKSPLAPGTRLMLFKIDPATGQLIPAISVLGVQVAGFVDTPGDRATFTGIASLSTVVGLALLPPSPPPPANHPPTGAVSVAGDLREGEIVLAVDTLADADGLGTLSYRWSLDDAQVAGISGNSFALDDIAVGKRVSVAVRYTDGRGFAERVSSAKFGPVKPAGTTLGFQKRVFFFNPASNAVQESLLRLINPNPAAVEVEIHAFDDSGAPGGIVTLSLSPGEALQLRSLYLEQGNPDLGLTGAFGDGDGKWQLKVNSSQPITVMSLVRVPGDQLASVSELALERAPRDYRVLRAHANTDASETSVIRVVNRSSAPAQVLINARDDAGQLAAGGSVAVSLAGNAAININTADYTLGNVDKGLLGAFGVGVGEWTLEVSGDRNLAVQGLLRSSDGILSNVSAAAPRASNATDGDRLLFTVNPLDGDQVSMLRVVNMLPINDSVILAGIDDNGQRPRGPMFVELPPLGAVNFTSRELELGAVSGGIAGVFGPFGDGVGRWQVIVSGGEQVEVQALSVNAGGVRTSLNNVAPAPNVLEAQVWLFNPASNLIQQSTLRLINLDNIPGVVLIEAIDDAGQPAPGGSVSVNISGNAAIELSAQDLEAGNTGKGVLGALGDGSGKWRLHISADVRISAQSLITSPTGVINDLSGIAQ
ncbi:MAG: beta-propeller fold lactonase family protein [Xanthomonadaceae bacterium]|nr:beta-propeller fold lactonase family protein [Xanthomonadaceae bacterium]